MPPPPPGSGPPDPERVYTTEQIREAFAVAFQGVRFSYPGEPPFELGADKAWDNFKVFLKEGQRARRGRGAPPRGP